MPVDYTDKPIDYKMSLTLNAEQLKGLTQTDLDLVHVYVQQWLYCYVQSFFNTGTCKRHTNVFKAQNDQVKQVCMSHFL